MDVHHESASPLQIGGNFIKRPRHTHTHTHTSNISIHRSQLTGIIHTLQDWMALHWIGLDWTGLQSKRELESSAHETHFPCVSHVSTTSITTGIYFNPIRRRKDLMFLRSSLTTGDDNFNFQKKIKKNSRKPNIIF